MSLFNETITRADRAEKALDLAQKRIAQLESQLKAANNETGRASLRFKELGGKSNVWRAPDSFPSEIARSASINQLTPRETENLFSQVRPRERVSKWRVLLLYLFRHRA